MDLWVISFLSVLFLAFLVVIMISIESYSKDKRINELQKRVEKLEAQQKELRTK